MLCLLPRDPRWGTADALIEVPSAAREPRTISELLFFEAWSRLEHGFEMFRLLPTAPQEGTADAEIKALAVENPAGVGHNTAMHASPTAGFSSEVLHSRFI